MTDEPNQESKAKKDSGAIHPRALELLRRVRAAGAPEPAKYRRDDVLRTARNMALHIHAICDQKHTRMVYHAAETGNLPVYREGSILCMRISVFDQWIAAQEARAWAKLFEIDSEEAPLAPETVNV